MGCTEGVQKGGNEGNQQPEKEGKTRSPSEGGNEKVREGNEKPEGGGKTGKCKGDGGTSSVMERRKRESARVRGK